MIRRVHLALGLGLFGLGGCVDPVEISSAYDEQVDLCADAADFDAAVAACRARRDADGSCSGVISFQGTIDGVDVRVTSDVELATLSNVALDEGDFRDGLEMAGASPYFDYRFSFSGLGGADEAGDASFEHTIELDPPCAEGESDGRAKLGLRVSSAGVSQDADLARGTLTITQQTAAENAGVFDGEYPDGSPLVGCFFMFTDQRVTEDATGCVDE